MKYYSVSKNGKLISKVFQQENANAGKGEAPHFQELTKIDIPDLDIHQQFFDDGEEEDGAMTRANHVKRNVRTGERREADLDILLSSYLVQGGSTPVRLPSAEDIAEYILLTGDQASVVNLIEGLVNNGKVSSYRTTRRPNITKCCVCRCLRSRLWCT